MQLEPKSGHSAGMVHSLDITTRLQGRIVEIASTAILLIGKTQAEADLVGLAHLRGELVTAVSAYVRHVTALQAAAQLPQAKLDALSRSCGNLDSAYEAFRARWVHRDSSVHWHEYRLSAAVLMKQIRSLVQSEEESADHTTSVAA